MSKDKSKSEFMGVHDISNELGVPSTTIRAWMSRGTRGFPSPVDHDQIRSDQPDFQAGRSNSKYFRRSDVERWRGDSPTSEHRPGRRTNNENTAMDLTDTAQIAGTNEDQFHYDAQELPKDRGFDDASTGNVLNQGSRIVTAPSHVQIAALQGKLKASGRW